MSDYFEDAAVGFAELTIFEYREPDELSWYATVIDVAAVVIEWAIDFNAIVDASDVVVLTMSRCCVHTASAAISGHIIG